MSTLRFFMPMIPPTVTAQEKGAAIRGKKIVFFEKPEVADAREKLKASLAPNVPEEKILGPIRLTTKWCFPKGRHRNGEYKITKPDTDNLQKLLKDVMTQVGFWKDDAQVCSEIVEKFWSDIPGIFIDIKKLGGDQS